MAKQRLPLWNNPQKFATVETDATIGAVVGQNLFFADGTLVTEADFTPDTPDDARVIWKYILEIPPNVTALANTTTTGLYAITGAGTSATRTIQNGPGIEWTNPGGIAGNPQAAFDADTAPVAALPGATYSTLQKLIDVMWSPGIITGGQVTALNPTTARILAGTAILRISDDNVSELRLCNFAQTDFAVPDVQTTHFYALDYNGGTPIVVQSLTDTWDRDTQIPLGSAFRLDGALNVTPNPYRVGDVITNLIQRADAIGPVLRDNSVGGLLISNTGTRNVAVTAGRLWSRVSDFNVPAKNSAVDTMFSAYFNGTNLTVTPGITQWDNLNFNNMGTGSLQLMANNKWANLWIFMSFDGTKYGFAYGTAEHNSLGAAATEGIPPYLTQNFFNQALLLGRFIFQKSAATPGLIETAFNSVFGTSAVNNHNDLAGLQGGAVAEYYHLTSAQGTDVSTLSTGGTTGQFWRGDKGYNNTLLYGGATIASPAAGVKIVSQNNTQSQLFEVITTGAGSTVGADICSTAYEDAGGGGLLHVRRARGTLAAPSAVLAGDIIGGISGRAWHSGGAFQPSGPASIHWVASENQTPTAFGSYMRFYSTPQGSTTRIERLVLTDVGATWSLGAGTFDPKSATQTQPFGTNTHRFLASAVGEASRITSIGYGSGGTPQINMAHANGTPAAPTAVLSGDQIGLISCIGYTGSTWVSAGLFRYQASENWTPTANGVDLILETVANGSASRTEKLRLWNDGRLSGTSLHNNAGTVTGTTDQFIASGTWTPVLTNTTNITASSASVCQWTRVGNVVNFSGRVTIDPTATGLIQLGASLPIASNFTAVEQAGGTGASNNEFFRIYADATNDRLMFESIIKADVASAGFHFSGSYLIA